MSSVLQSLVVAPCPTWQHLRLVRSWPEGEGTRTLTAPEDTRGPIGWRGRVFVFSVRSPRPEGENDQFLGFIDSVLIFSRSAELQRHLQGHGDGDSHLVNVRFGFEPHFSTVEVKCVNHGADDAPPLWADVDNIVITSDPVRAIVISAIFQSPPAG